MKDINVSTASLAKTVQGNVNHVCKSSLCLASVLLQRQVNGGVSCSAGINYISTSTPDYAPLGTQNDLSFTTSSCTILKTGASILQTNATTVLYCACHYYVKTIVCVYYM